MKKVALSFLALALAGSMAFGQDAAAKPAVALSGSVGISLGNDLKPGTPDLPVFSGSSSGAATATLSSADAKVSASITLDLLAQGSTSSKSTIKYDNAGQTLYAITAVTGDNLSTTTVMQDWIEYKKLAALVKFYNDNNEAITVGGAAGSAFLSTDRATLVTALGAFAAKDGTVTATSDLVLRDYVAKGTTEGDTKKAWDGNEATTVAATIKTAFASALSTVVNAAIVKILDTATLATVLTPATTDLPAADAVTSITVSNLLLAKYNSDLGGKSFDYYSAYYKKLTTAEQGKFDEAYKLYKANALLNSSSSALVKTTIDTVTTVTAPAYVTAANIAFKSVAGLLDLGLNYKGQSLSVGGIKIDGRGHSDTTDNTSVPKNDYHSVTVGLASGVLSNVSLGGAVYFDDSRAANEKGAVTDEWYTFKNEAADAADVSEVKLAYAFNGAYTLADILGAGSKAVIGANLGMYAANLGYAITADVQAPGGITANVGYASGLGISDINLGVGLDLGIVAPKLTIESVSNPADYDLYYDKDEKYGSGTSAVKGLGGLDVNVSLPVSLKDLGLSFPIKVGYAMATGKTVLSYSAGVSGAVAGIDLGASYSDVGIYKGEVKSWTAIAANVGYKLAAFNTAIAANVGMGSGRNAADDADLSVMTYGVKVSYTPSTVPIVFEYTGTDKPDADGDVFGKYSISTSISF